MSAIITEKFRQHNANQFSESFTETALNKYYLFLGKASPFTSGTTTGSDGIPPIPGDSPNEEFRAWDAMLAAKKITSSDITYAIPRRNWQLELLLICTNITLVHQIQLPLVHQTFMTQHFIL